MMALLEMLPEGKFKQAAMEAVGAKALYDVSQKPAPAEEIKEIMKSITPYFVIGPAIREMARAAYAGPEGDANPKLDELKGWVEEQFRSLRQEMEREREEKKWEERLEAIEKKFTERLEALRPKEEGKAEGKVVEELKSLKEAITKKERDEQLAKLEKQGEDLQRMIDDLRSKMSRPAEERPRDVVDEMSVFAEKASKFFDGIANLAKSMGYAKEEEIIKGEDRFSKILQFGDRALKEMRKMAETWRQPAPARETVQTAPVIPAPAPKPEAPAPAPPAEAPKPETPA
jgi:hypothetical protein